MCKNIFVRLFRRKKIVPGTLSDGNMTQFAYVVVLVCLESRECVARSAEQFVFVLRPSVLPAAVDILKGTKMTCLRLARERDLSPSVETCRVVKIQGENCFYDEASQG